MTSPLNKVFWTEPRFRLYRLALFFLALVLASEIGVRIYFSRRGIADRNPGNTTSAMAYLLEQMAKSTRPRVVFIGSSVTQGYGNCPPGKHFPALVEKELRRNPTYKRARSFNLSSAGNRFGDHFANLVESARHQPDLVVCAVHIKMFSVHASLIEPFTHPESVYYFRGDPLYGRGGPKDMTRRIRLSRDRFREIWIDFQVQKLSGVYRYRRLMSYLVSGQHQFPAQAASDRLRAWLGFMDPILVEAYDTNFEERNADYLWKVIPEHVVQLQYQHTEAFDFSDENINFMTLRDFCDYAQKRKIKVLFFLNPINKDFAADRGFFNWDEVVPTFRSRLTSMIRSYGHMVVDATQAIDSRYFSDLDHLNMNGHKQMTRFLMPYVYTMLRKEN